MTDVPARSAFLIRDGATIEAAWMLGGELPDIDAVVEAARAYRPAIRSLGWSIRRPNFLVIQPMSQ